MGGTTVTIHVDYSQSDFWVKITCHALLMFPALLRLHLYASLSFDTSNTLWQTLFFHNLKAKGWLRIWELFILWAALHEVRNNTGFHITTQHDEQAKNGKVVMTADGIVMTLARGLELQDLFSITSILHEGGCMAIVFTWSSP